MLRKEWLPNRWVAGLWSSGPICRRTLVQCCAGLDPVVRWGAGLWSGGPVAGLWSGALDFMVR